MPALSRILVPTDFGEASKKGLLHALNMSKQLGGSVHVLYIWTEPALLGSSSSLRLVSGETVSVGDFARSNAAALMDALLQQLPGSADVEVTNEILFGDPASAIVRAAEHFDLVVMGIRQRPGPLRHWLGSVAEKVVRLSPVAVLTVPAKDSK